MLMAQGFSVRTAHWAVHWAASKEMARCRKNKNFAWLSFEYLQLCFNFRSEDWLLVVTGIQVTGSIQREPSELLEVPVEP